MRDHELRGCKPLLPLVFALLSACSAPEPPASTCSPDIASIQQRIFVPSCAQAGCHGEIEPAAALVLTGEGAAAALIGVPSATCADRVRVVPGSPEQSLLYEKITAAAPSCGGRMPPSGSLAAEEIECVRAWIASQTASDAGAGDACETCGEAQCVDFMTDPAHCGDCETACPLGASCAAGACSCGGGLTACGSACIDTSADQANCGKCDNVCEGGMVCNAGTCSASCGSLTQCGASCVDTATSSGHCGGCDKPCSLGATCVGGMCQCGSASVSLSADVQPIFTASCASNGCHKGVNPQQGLDLTAGKSHADLVNVPAQQCNDGRTLVLPGQAAESYLINKITGVDMCSGTQMPKLNKLSAAQIETITNWICAGAPNN